MRAFKRHKPMLFRFRTSPSGLGDSRQSQRAPRGSFQVSSAIQASNQGQTRSRRQPGAVFTVVNVGSNVMVMDTLKPDSVERSIKAVASCAAVTVSTYFAPKLTCQGRSIQAFVTDPDVRAVVQYMENAEAASRMGPLPTVAAPAALPPYLYTTALTLTYTPGCGVGGHIHIVRHVDENNAGSAQSLQTLFQSEQRVSDVADQQGVGSEDLMEVDMASDAGGLQLELADGTWTDTPTDSLVQQDFNRTPHRVVAPPAGKERVGLVRYRNVASCKGGDLQVLGAARLHGCSVSYEALREWLKALVAWNKGEISMKPQSPMSMCELVSSSPEVWWCKCQKCQKLRREHNEWLQSQV